ncbi:MAG: flagellar basal body rod protein FlgB [Oscillospiraceae bacterium]
MIDRRVSQQAMEKSMDALWAEMRVHQDNIANYETPDYKAKKVEFSEVLDKTQKKGNKTSAKLRMTITSDTKTDSRVDGNNVDMEAEQLQMWKAQAQYAALTQKISGAYKNLSTVINTVGR